MNFFRKRTMVAKNDVEMQRDLSQFELEKNCDNFLTRILLIIMIIIFIITIVAIIYLYIDIIFI